MSKSSSKKQTATPPTAHLSTLFLLAMATVYLFSVPAAGYTEIVQWKYRLFLWLTGGYLVATLLLQLELRLLGAQSRVSPGKPAPVALCLLLYVLCTGISALVSPFSGVLLGNARREGVLTIVLYVAAALCLMRHFRPNRWLLPVFGAAVCGFCLLGLMQLTGANPLGLYPEGYCFYDAGVAYSGQYWSTIGNTNLCAAVLVLSAGLFLAAAICGSRPGHWLALIPGNLAVFCILELNAEAGLVALLGGLILLPPILVRSGQQVCRTSIIYGSVLLTFAVSRTLQFYHGGLHLEPTVTAAAALAGAALLAGTGLGPQCFANPQSWNGRRLRQILTGIAVCVIAAGLIVLYVCDTLPAGFLSEAHLLLNGQWDSSFGSGRLHIWQQVWGAVRQRPLLGGGPDTLRFRALTGFTRYSAELDQTIHGTIDVAHNEYLNILVNQGVLALLAYLAALLLSVPVWLRSDAPARRIAGAAVLFYCIQAFFGISMCLSAPYFWIALGVLNCPSCAPPHCGVSADKSTNNKKERCK